VQTLNAHFDGRFILLEESEFKPVYKEPFTEKSKAASFVVQPLDVIDLWNGNRN
jgi:hypothetical protein